MLRKYASYRKGYLVAPLLAVLLTGFYVATPALAQSCSHVIFDTSDTSSQLSESEICTASQGLGDEGIQLFVLLSDYEPSSQDDWFNYVDGREAAAGLRDLSADTFARNALALEASTSGRGDGYSITLGEVLWDTAVDTDADRLEQLLRTGVTAGDPSAGFINAVTEADVLYSRPANLGADVLETPASGGSALAFLGTTLAVLGLGALGFGGAYAYPRVLKPRLEARRKREELVAHLAAIQQPIGTLLNAIYRLLDGPTPDDALLYQLFKAYGGEESDAMRTQVADHIKQSQLALNDAFDLHKKLNDEELKQQRPLEQQARDWEMVYLTLVGHTPEIRSLTDDQLHDLLNPMLVVDREPRRVAGLAGQLDAIRADIEGQPLKIEPLYVDPQALDEQGILGYVDATKAVIKELQTAQAEAPGWIDKAREKRLGVEEELPADPFGMTRTGLFGAIDRLLENTQTELSNGRFLHTIDGAMATLEGLQVIEDYHHTRQTDAQRRQSVDAILSEGYHPPFLGDREAELTADQTAIQAALTEGEYLAAAQWNDELDDDSARLLEEVQAWRALHLANSEHLARLRTRLATLRAESQARVSPAWEALRQYPDTNWAELTDGPERPLAELDAIQSTLLPGIQDANALEGERLVEAEEDLAVAQARLDAAEQGLMAIPQRLAAVETAATNLPAGLAVTADEIARATSFRDSEDVKITAEVDGQLAEATLQLAEGRTLFDRRSYIAAAVAEGAARALAVAAYADASAQVGRIDALHQALAARQAELAAAREALQNEMALLTPVMRSEALGAAEQAAATALAEAAKTGAETLHREDEAWAEALAAALTAADEALTAVTAAHELAQSDRESYETLLKSAEAALTRADARIGAAAVLVKNKYSGDKSQTALRQAREILPPLSHLTDAPRGAIERAQSEAEKAEAYAIEAQRAAKENIDWEEHRRRMRRMQSSSGGWWLPTPGSTPGRGGWSSPGRSTSRPRSSGSSRRSGSSGGSRRSGSFGGARRSSSMGGSRRR